MSAPTKTTVVGAGLGGLAAAIHLLAAGHEVTVVEGREQIGGRASQLRDGGYTWDMGPSLITMPWLLEELFSLAGARVADELTLHALDPFYRIYWEDDGRWFDFGGDRERMAAEVGKFSSVDAGRYDAFMEASRRMHEDGVLVAGRQSFLRLADFVPLVPTMLRLGAIRSLGGFVGHHFREPHVRQAFDFHSLFIGGDPFRVPALYAALGYLQVADGVWYADGGVHALVEALGRLVVRGGGTILTGRRVEAIETLDRRVRGVRLAGGERIAADVVVSNADSTATRRRLIDPAVPDALPWRWRRPRQTMSCFLLYLGTTRQFPRLLHHTLFVGSDYRGFIRDVTATRRVSDSLSLYVHAPARTEPGMAAPGGDALTILLPVPNLASGDDWTIRGPEVRDRVIDFLQGPGGLDGLADSIAVEHSWTPLDFRRQLEAPLGNAFATEPLLWQSAYFRQPNRDRTVGGLYYVGAGTHPGGGIPGVMLGAGVTASVIAADRDAEGRAGRSR
ncbi:MAG: phytoene desaturase family protein [Chloroflexi bacterium]|nr:phytoene desaturase family protein [Chloroflexota bacterium]